MLEIKPRGATPPPPPHCVQWHHAGGLKSAMVGLFIPWKSEKAINQGFSYSFVDCLDLEKKKMDW